MRSIHSKIEGDVISSDDLALHGMVAGSAGIAAGVMLMLHGMVTGDLILEAGSFCELRGMVTGNVRNKGGELFVYGTVKGAVLTLAGSTVIDPKAVIDGGVHQLEAAGRIACR